jgi:pimeloyl-ACP methyl ester carboxylesterase
VRPLVISLHGIRTRGSWQKDLAIQLNRAGFDYSPLDFGFFHALQLFWPAARERRVRWFRDVYTRTAGENNGAPISVVAHSFGTYLVARAMERFPEVTFDRLVLCGSIVRRDYPWTKVIHESKQVVEVLNDYGRMDLWAGIVRWFVADAGPSGTKGFTDDASGRVIQREHAEFSHSDYFYDLNYDKTWIPFLNGLGPAPLLTSGRQATNWRFRATVILLALLTGLLVAGMTRILPTLFANRGTGLPLSQHLGMTSTTCAGYQSAYTKLPLPPRTKLTDEQHLAATSRRICINSYPWRKGKYLDTVTHEEMNEIRNEANRKFDSVVAQRLAEGKTDETYASLVRPYGDLLYMLVLRRESRFVDMMRHYTEANTIQALSRNDFSTSDDAEEATYFTRDSLNKLITLLYYDAVAKAPSLPQATIRRTFDEYIAHRASFVFQMDVVGDPYYALLHALGCEPNPQAKE